MTFSNKIMINLPLLMMGPPLLSYYQLPIDAPFPETTLGLRRFGLAGRERTSLAACSVEEKFDHNSINTLPDYVLILLIAVLNNVGKSRESCR